MRVLVTGVSGFMGKRMYALLEREGVYVHGISRRRGDFGGRWTGLDITDLEGLSSLVKKEDFDVIIHLGALTKRRYGDIPAERYFEVNVGGTENVLRAAGEVGAKVVFASTAGVYTSSKHPYIESKRIAEEVCGRYGAIIARIFNVYGEGKEGGVIEAFIKRAFKNEPLLVNSGQVRDFIYVDDVCRALWVLALRAGPGSYDVGTGVGRTIEEVAELVKALTGSSSPIEVRPAEPSISIADVDPLRALGFEPEVEFEEGLRRVIEYMRSRTGSGARPGSSSSPGS